MYQEGIYKVIRDSKGYVLINTIGEYKSHGHLKSLHIAKKVIKMMKKGTVPDSDYLRGTVLRVSTDKAYIDKVNQKIIKDRNKLGFININKGLVR
jgi:hypothetical protein